MQSLEGACEEGERTIKKLKTSRSSLPLLHPQESSEAPENSTPPNFCIFTKFLELYQEECAINDNSGTNTGIKKNSNILEKLVARERLNTLILNLYPGNKGYSLAFRTTSRANQNSNDTTANMIETKEWPYEEDELLRFIDNEELPPYLIDIFESHYTFLFYNGCIIAEVRDYRQSYPHNKCDIHHVLLRPTLRSLLADINNLTEEKVDWGTEERQQLESQLLLANKPTLCLAPDKSVGAQQARVTHNRQMWHSHRFHRAARKFSQVAVNRKRKLDQFTHKPGLELFDFMARARTKPKVDISRPLAVPNLDPPPIAPPSQGVFIKDFFKTYQRPKETSDCLPQLLEEYVLETDMPSKEKGKHRVYHIKLSIFQRPSNSEYLGELYVDRDHKKNERNGVACRFSLGSRANANRYIHQFTEAECSRKSVRIRNGLSPAYKERVAQAQAQVQSQGPAQGANLAQQHLTQLSQTLQNQSIAGPLMNGSISSRISLVQQNQSIQNTSSSVPILQGHLQGTTPIKPDPQVSTQQLEINALATKLMNCAQQFQAAENARQQQQARQKLTHGRNHTTMINLLNSSPVSNVNSDESAAVVNAINSTSTLQAQQVPTLPTINQKLLARKLTMANARVLNHGNLIVNNNRMNIAEVNQQAAGSSQTQSAGTDPILGTINSLTSLGQTITLNSGTSGGANFTNYTAVPIKGGAESNAALSALLVGTSSADRPDISGSTNSSSLLLEKLASSSASSSSSSNFVQSLKSGLQYMVQSPPKASTVISPLSSPPPQNANTINLAQLQNISGLQNIQVQLPGFAQPISLSLNVSSTGTIPHGSSLLVSLPVTASSTTNTVTQQTAGNVGAGVGTIGGQTVVLANAGTSNLAQLVTSGMKGLSQQGMRAGGSTAVSIAPGGQPIQLLTPLQRPRLQPSGLQQNLTNRTIQRTPITIKMATPNSNATPVALPSGASLSSQLQKQAQYQQYQQLCVNQPQNVASVAGKLRRRSNTSDQQ